MKTLSAALIAQLEAGTAIIKVCAELRFDSEAANYLRYNDADIDIYLGSDRFIHNGMRLESIHAEAGLAAAEAQLSIPNADRFMGQYLLGGEYRGSDILIHWAALDTFGSTIDWDTFFWGEFDDYEIRSDRVVLYSISEMVAWQEKHMQKSGPTCWKPFGSAFCAYSGSETWCDQTYARCQALLNTDNFGGSRWLSETAEQELWWGRTPS